MPVPSSVRARLNAILSEESLGSGWVEARNAVEIGNLVSRSNLGDAGAFLRSNAYIWVGRFGSGLSPSDAVVRTVPSGLILSLV